MATGTLLVATPPTDSESGRLGQLAAIRGRLPARNHHPTTAHALASKSMHISLLQRSRLCRGSHPDGSNLYIKRRESCLTKGFVYSFLWI
jgi:hypothetical protein